MGKLAIISLLGVVESSNLSSSRQQEVFNNESEWLKDKYDQEGNYDTVELYQAYDSSVIGDVLRDKETSGLVFVGHGGAGHGILPYVRFIGWQDIAKESGRRNGHLKLGDFVQRTCGHIPDSGLIVPLGTFAMADQRNILAPLGIGIPDERPDEALFRQIYDKAHNTPEDIRQVVDDARQR